MNDGSTGLAHDIEGRCDVIECDKPSGFGVDINGEKFKICASHVELGWGPSAVEARPGPEFQAFADSLHDEARWSAMIHAGDKTGQSLSDQEALERLARKVEEVGRKLGFI